MPVHAALRAWEFLRDWRAATGRAYRLQYGFYLAVPVLWACAGGLLPPLVAASGFLATALFLEGRPGRRLTLQTLLYLLVSQHPGVAALAREPGGCPEAAQGRCRLDGRVQGFPAPSGRAGGLGFLLDTQHGRYRVLAENPGFPIVPGQRLAVSGRGRPVEAPTNPGQFDYRLYLRSQAVDGLVQADALRELAPPGPFHRLVAAARGAVETGLARTVPPAQLPLFEAALLGKTAALDPEILADFRDSGMLHILAISGQHVGIIAMILLQFASLLRLPRKAAFVATALIVALYVPVCGGSISVVRSALMFAVGLPAVLWERPGSGLNALGLAAALCLLLMPGQILSLGFQLSFGATFLLLLYSRPVSRGLALLPCPGPLRPLLDYAWPTLALSGIIFLGLTPLLAATVHTVSPTSVPGNLATVGLSTAMIIAGILALLAAPAGLVGGCLGESAGLLASLLARSVGLLADLPGSSLATAALPWPAAALLLFLVLALPFALRRRSAPGLSLGVLLVLAGGWAARAAHQAWARPAEAVFLDIGQGDATVLRLPGADILVDAGPPGAGRKAIVPYLKSLGIGRLDLVVVTHPDLDHYGGLAEVAEAVPIGRVIHSGDDAEARAWRDLKTRTGALGIPWEAARRGQLLYRHRDLELRVLGPEGPGRFPNRNDNSLLCVLHAHGTRVLLTGDMERQAQAALLADGGPGTGGIVKVPHHGSDRTTDMGFLSALAPETAIISAGRRNRFGHPGPLTLETLSRLGARVLATPAHGAVTCRLRRDGHACEAFLPETATIRAGGAAGMESPRRSRSGPRTGAAGGNK